MCAVAGRAVGEGQEVVVGVVVVTLVGGVGQLCRKNRMGECRVFDLCDFAEFSLFEGVAIYDTAVAETWYGSVCLKFGVVVPRALECL